MKSDTPAVGMTDEVHASATAVDQVDRPFRLVGQRENMLTGPRPRDVVAEMLRCGQLIADAEHATEFTPLFWTRT
jgi:hypothetical protein